MFTGLLRDDDARRARETLEVLLDHGVRGALTGGLAIATRLRECGRRVEPRPLGDIDLVVDGFASIPESLAGAFLQHHVHPEADTGRTLLQFVDESRRLRVDVFRQLGRTLSRARPVHGESRALDVISIEDLVARTTSLVAGRLRRSLSIDVKHVNAFMQLRGLGHAGELAAAWRDHCQQVPGTLEDASAEAMRLIAARPDLVVVETYSREVRGCDRCRAHGRFRPAPPHTIVEILGYC